MVEEPRSTSFVTGIVRDALTIALLGVAVIASFVLTVFAQLASSVLSDVLDEGTSALAVRAVSLAVALAIDVGVAWVILGAAPRGQLLGRDRLVAAAVAGLGVRGAQAARHADRDVGLPQRRLRHLRGDGRGAGVAGVRLALDPRARSLGRGPLGACGGLSRAWTGEGPPDGEGEQQPDHDDGDTAKSEPRRGERA